MSLYSDANNGIFSILCCYYCHIIYLNTYEYLYIFKKKYKIIMRSIIFTFITLVLFSCGNSPESNESNNAIVSETTGVKETKSTFGEVTELNPEDNIKFKKIILADPYEFKERYDNGLTVIDVRTAGVFAKGHISGAINIDLLDVDFTQKIVKHLKDRPILVYSQEGVKSQEATHLMETAGFKKIFNLEGGYDAWKKIGF